MKIATKYLVNNPEDSSDRKEFDSWSAAQEYAESCAFDYIDTKIEIFKRIAVIASKRSKPRVYWPTATEERQR